MKGYPTKKKMIEFVKEKLATDPEAANGQVYGPRWNVRGAPVEIGREEKRLASTDTDRMWQISEAQTGTVFSLGN